MTCRAAGHSERNLSTKYQKFEFYSVGISKDLNNMNSSWGKHLVTSIVVLSDEKQAPCYRQDLRLSHSQGCQTENYTVTSESIPFIYSLTCVSILNIFTLKEDRELLKCTLTASLRTQQSSLINTKNLIVSAGLGPHVLWCPAHTVGRIHVECLALHFSRMKALNLSKRQRLKIKMAYTCTQIRILTLTT